MHRRLVFITSCVIGSVMYASNASALFNQIKFVTQPGNPIVAFNSSMMVPNIPFTPSPATHNWLIYIWPGLDPNGACYFPINNGVLQPVLTFGIPCTTNAPAIVGQWWISGQYVNTNLHDCKNPMPAGFTKEICMQYQGCNHVGDYLLLQPGQVIQTSITYNNADQSWTQTGNVVGTKLQMPPYSIKLNYCSATNAQSASVTRQPQEQNFASLTIESYNYAPPITQVFTNISLVIDVTKTPTATCNSVFKHGITIPKNSSCTPMITEGPYATSNQLLLTCKIASCSVYKPATTAKEKPRAP